MGRKNAKLYRDLRTAYLEQGDREALETARALLERQKNITLGDKERLFGFLEGGGKIILPDPQAMLTQAPKMPGLDGRKMSKSYDNVISLRDPPAEVERKLRTMPTDPARVHRDDPGDPDKCPVWDFHMIYSDAERKGWVETGCRSAKIGCLKCKQTIIAPVLAELKPMQERAVEFSRDPLLVRNIIADGCKSAQDAAEARLVEGRAAIGWGYR